MKSKTFYQFVFPVFLGISAIVADLVVESSEEIGVRQFLSTLQARWTIRFNNWGRLTFNLQFKALSRPIHIFFNKKSGIRIDKFGFVLGWLLTKTLIQWIYVLLGIRIWPRGKSRLLKRKCFAPVLLCS